MKKTVTCTICPNGCEIEVNYTTREDAALTGHRCKRGITYAIDECFEPKRTFTSSVKISGTDRRVLPVRTIGPIPKDMIMTAAEAVSDMALTVPVKCGEVLAENFLGTDVKLVSAMTLE
jgi:CxxC motif-containing protein